MIQLEERLYTSTEVAEILGVSLRSVYRYLEEGKLDAEIKTATGRHRFSKKNIMDFLYPDGSSTARDLPESAPVKETPRRVIVEEKPVIKETRQETSIPAAKKEEPKPVEVEEAPATQEEEPVDWLAKFREAAKKFREETDEPQEENKPEPVYKEEPAPAEKFSGFSNFTPAPEPVREQPVTTKVLYYRSSLGGLKDIAQNIDKTSRSAGVPYAFSMNAGLSLYKPIKPFSVLHAYVKPQDLPFFERVLSLTPAEEVGAQLCLYVSSDTSLFANREEMHGLFVVNKKKLLEDISKTGDAALIDEAKSVL